ncbi:MAG: DUF305 domain-containing protein [Pseudomonadota bacterium]
MKQAHRRFYAYQVALLAMGLVTAPPSVFATTHDHHKGSKAHAGHGGHGTHNTGHAKHGGHTGHPTAKTKSGEKLSAVSAAYDKVMQRMHNDMAIAYTNTLEIDFVRGMIPHHQGAIDQAKILRDHSQNLRIRRLAAGIIASQTREIRFMEQWLNDNKADQVPAASKGLSDVSKSLDEAMHKMHRKMALPYANDVDLDFVRGMIPHHQGAIDQSEIFLANSKNLRLRRLAGGIVRAQTREIVFMRKWLKEYEKGVETGEMPDWLASTPETLDQARERPSLKKTE